MARLLDWQNRLSIIIHARREVAFDFPNWNCLLWAADTIIACRGDDILEAYRGKYKDEIAAARLLRKLDKVKTSQALLVKKLNHELKPIAFARPGDIVFADILTEGLELPPSMNLFGPVPGVCYGSISYFVGEQGLIEVSTLTLGQALWVS